MNYALITPTPPPSRTAPGQQDPQAVDSFNQNLYEELVAFDLTHQRYWPRIVLVNNPPEFMLRILRDFKAIDYEVLPNPVSAPEPICPGHTNEELNYYLNRRLLTEWIVLAPTETLIDTYRWMIDQSHAVLLPYAAYSDQGDPEADPAVIDLVQAVVQHATRSNKPVIELGRPEFKIVPGPSKPNRQRYPNLAPSVRREQAHMVMTQ